MDAKPYKGKTGLYVLYDSSLSVAWYVGKSEKPIQGIQGRFTRHCDRIYGRASDKPMPAWVVLEQWIKNNQYDFSYKTEVAVLITEPNQYISLAEAQLIVDLEPLVNKETFDEGKFYSLLRGSLGGN